ncbi:hypothetical protein HQQ80_12455 [Microbacteriaceae bacterium VKM Ac-2855]|nr:hypothetical protein [Microbacteriaceae bacterium VKM Ac-2855]
MAEWATDTGDDAEHEVRNAITGLTELRDALTRVANEIAQASADNASLPHDAEWDDGAARAFAVKAEQLLASLDTAREQTFEAVGRAQGALEDVLGRLSVS